MLDYLDYHGRRSEATHVIAVTRTYSKASSALAGIFAGGLLFLFRDYAVLFWLSAASAGAGAVLIISYPKYLEGEHQRDRASGVGSTVAEEGRLLKMIRNTRMWPLTDSLGHLRKPGRSGYLLVFTTVSPHGARLPGYFDRRPYCNRECPRQRSAHRRRQRVVLRRLGRRRRSQQCEIRNRRRRSRPRACVCFIGRQPRSSSSRPYVHLTSARGSGPALLSLVSSLCCRICGGPFT